LGHTCTYDVVYIHVCYLRYFIDSFAQYPLAINKMPVYKQVRCLVLVSLFPSTPLWCEVQTINTHLRHTRIANALNSFIDRTSNWDRRV